MPELDYLAALRRESVRFHQCLCVADPVAPVPSCPEVSSFEPSLAADGVDKILMRMYGGYPEWAAFEATPGTGRVISSDTDSSWDFTSSRFSGTNPATGNAYDDPTIVVSPGGLPDDPAFTVTIGAL